MMTGISEAWEIMVTHMDMKYDEVGKVFEKWCSEGELVSSTPKIRLISAYDLRKILFSSRLAQISVKRLIKKATMFLAMFKTR